MRKKDVNSHEYMKWTSGMEYNINVLLVANNRSQLKPTRLLLEEYQENLGETKRSIAKK